MEFRFAPEEEAFREELRAFLRQELPSDWNGRAMDYSDDAEWELGLRLRRKMGERGWLSMHWPPEYGGQGASPLRSLIFNEEIVYHGAPGRDMFGTRMLGPTLMLFGTEEQKYTFLPPISRGEVQWSQGYSEPGTGSDLASLQTRAVEDGDDFVVNGSKIWTSGAHRADWMFMLARTDPEAPKHKGISFLLVDLRSPGITVRPILNMTGLHYFNQVFFDNVRVPKRNLVGEQNAGWYVAVTLLDFERSGIDYPSVARRLLKGLVAYARETRVNGGPLYDDPVVRTMLAERAIEAQVSRLLAYNVAWLQSQGKVPNKESSISKVFGSEMLQRTANTGMRLLGLYGLLTREEPRWARLKGQVQELWRASYAHTLAGGTSEVQRHVIATRGLGLPRG
ncbi:MAG: acyl-CoA dehydrogenase family protein [Dehalococcoidia bacterium]